MRRNRLLALFLPLALVMAACGDSDDSKAEATRDDSGETLTVEHFSGTDEVPVNPETVVVLDTGVELSLDEMGVAVDGHAIMGDVPDDLSDVLEDPEREPVGTAFEPDYEAINALEPDLIIVSGRSSDTYPEMSEIAPTVDLTFDPDMDHMDTFRERHEILGQIFEVEDEAAELLDDLDDSIEDLADRTDDAGGALILMTSANEVSAYGPGSRFGMVHDVFGYDAADDSLSDEATHGEVISFEFILEAEPDVMFVIDRSAAIGDDGDAAEKVLDNKLVSQTPAWEDDRVVYVDSYAWYIAPNSFQGLRQMMADVEASLP